MKEEGKYWKGTRNRQENGWEGKGRLEKGREKELRRGEGRKGQGKL